MSKRWFYCQPCDHTHWWEHRHPNPRVSAVGLALLLFGVAQAVFGLSLLLAR